MACSVYGCHTTGTEPNIVLYPYPTDYDLCAQWVSAAGRGPEWWPGALHRVCSRHFPGVPVPTDLPTIDLPPPPDEQRIVCPEPRVVKKKCSDNAMTEFVKELLEYPQTFCKVKLSRILSGGKEAEGAQNAIVYAKLWLMYKWRKKIFQNAMYSDTVFRCRHHAPQWMLRAEHELQLVDYIMRKDHLHHYTYVIQQVCLAVSTKRTGELATIYNVSIDRILTVWHLLSSSILMKLHWLSVVGDVWSLVPRAVALTTTQWAVANIVIKHAPYCNVLVYSTSWVGRPIQLLLYLVHVYRLEDAAPRELRLRRWAAACRRYRDR